MVGLLLGVGRERALNDVGLVVVRTTMLSRLKVCGCEVDRADIN